MSWWTVWYHVWSGVWFICDIVCAWMIFAASYNNQHGVNDWAAVYRSEIAVFNWFWNDSRWMCSYSIRYRFGNVELSKTNDKFFVSTRYISCHTGTVKNSMFGAQSEGRSANLKQLLIIIMFSTYHAWTIFFSLYPGHSKSHSLWPPLSIWSSECVYEDLPLLRSNKNGGRVRVRNRHVSSDSSR